jgi:hypothetical protein
MTNLTLADCRPATSADIDRGVAAARAVFHAAGLPADYCQGNAAAQDEGGLHFDARAALTWRAADCAAVLACCAGWRRVPEPAHLELGTAPDGGRFSGVHRTLIGHDSSLADTTDSGDCGRDVYVESCNGSVYITGPFIGWGGYACLVEMPTEYARAAEDLAARIAADPLIVLPSLGYDLGGDWFAPV